MCPHASPSFLASRLISEDKDRSLGDESRLGACDLHHSCQTQRKKYDHIVWPCSATPYVSSGSVHNSSHLVNKYKKI